MRHDEKDVTLMVDEMQVTKSLEYDKGLNTFLGRVSEEVVVKACDSGEVVLVSHALVFMIRGLTSNWKQVVAYFLEKLSW